MTQSETPMPRPRKQRPRQWNQQRILIVLTAIIGMGVLLYPTAAAWFSDRIHATEINGYVATVENLAPADKQAIIEEARRFNAELPSGPLRDPYSLNSNGEQATIGAGSDAYKKILDVGPEGMMGRINIPSINVSLPIFHGTDEAALAKGVGHLFGSGLPVGGENTHSVLTGHSGFVNATLFDDLNKLTEGDTFTVTVLNETLYYQVDQILTVLPDETDDLRQVKGKDLVTLITCTPTGVNSHRLLVRGERIDPPATDTGHILPSTVADPGFPWWALAMAGAAIISIGLTRPRTRPSETKQAMSPAEL
jgi:sortase A